MCMLLMHVLTFAKGYFHKVHGQGNYILCIHELLKCNTLCLKFKECAMFNVIMPRSHLSMQPFLY